jgi:hypothetical protein
MMNAPVTLAPVGITVTGGMRDSAVLCVNGTAHQIAITAIRRIFNKGA